MKYLIYYLLSALIILTGCQAKNSQDREVQKLLDLQAELNDSQEVSVDRIRQIQDSLKLEKQALLIERDMKGHEVERLKNNQQALVDRLNTDQKNELASEKSRLRDQIASYEDSITKLKASLSMLGSDIDSVRKHMEFYGIQEGQAEKEMATGISRIDRRLSKLEERKQEYSERADILSKRISIYDKKIGAYNMERELYVNERDKLLRENGPDDAIAPYLQKISSLDSTLQEQKENQKLLKDELGQVKGWISDTDDRIAELKSGIENQYDRKESIESYIASGQQRLEKELKELQSTRENLISQQDQIAGERARVEREIASLDDEMELVRSRKMSDILDLQAGIHEADAGLAEKEIKNLKKGSVHASLMPDTAGAGLDPAGMKNLMVLSQQVDSLQESLAKEQAEITRTRMELAIQKARIAKKRAAFGHTIGILAIILMAGGLGIVSIFYILGKRTRASHQRG